MTNANACKLFAFGRCLKFLSGAVLLLCGAALGQWTPDYQLTTSGSASTTYSNAWSVAACGSLVHVVWVDLRDGNAEVYYKRSSDRGLNWGSDIRLTYNSGQSWNPCVACQGQVVHVVWSDTRSGNLDVYYKRSSDGGFTWGPDVQLTNDLTWSYYPSLAVHDSSVYMVALSGGLICRRSADCGMTWQGATTLSTDAYLTPGPSVAASEYGVYVTWVGIRDGNEEIYFKRSTSRGTTWGPDARLSFDSHTSSDPSIAMSGTCVHVVWSDDRTGDGSEVYYRQSMDDGESWGAETRMTTSPDWSTSPSVAASGSNVHIAWQDARTGDFEIIYRRSTDGGTSWGADFALTNDPASSLYPSATVSDSALFVVWTDERTGGSDIFFKSNPTGNPPSVTESTERVGPQVRATFRVEPNPFCASARVPGCESETFDVYDATGKRVAVCPGSAVCGNLPAGTYFIHGRQGAGVSVAIVKSR